MDLHFNVVPAYDLVLSLAAAAHWERYELSASWARQVRQALPIAIRTDLKYFFGDPLILGAGGIQIIPDLSDGEPETFLRAIAGMDAADVVAAILSRGADRDGLRAGLRRMLRAKGVTEADEAAVSKHLSGLRSETRARFREILQDPEGMRLRYVRLMQAHAQGWFTANFSEVTPFLAQRVKQGRRSIGKQPALEVIARVTGGLTLQAPLARSVSLVPSYYAAPFIFVVRDGRDVVVVYGTRPAEETGHSTIDGQTVRVLKALADETRLRILQLLARRPLYGQQLADALGVSHPTISHHMAQLRIAGLTRTELTEDGSKTYSVQPETVERLCSDLRIALVDAAAPVAEVQ
jgi:DNA-binding transcriptional ArsR family regulator